MRMPVEVRLIDQFLTPEQERIGPGIAARRDDQRADDLAGSRLRPLRSKGPEVSWFSPLTRGSLTLSGFWLPGVQGSTVEG
jgi:hypothetical protein